MIGEPADGINVVWYAAEGDHVNAALSGAAMVPVLGAGATAAKVGVKGVKAADEAAAAAKKADEAAMVKAVDSPPETALLEGPVRFNPPPHATGEELAATREHVRRSQEVLEAGGLSATGRVPVSQTLREQATRDARRERRRAAAEGRPYAKDEHAGHVPDTTWTGVAAPPGGYQVLPERVNSSVGGQANRYPVGYKPTRFEFGGD